METTIQLYQRAKEAARCETDYAFAKKFGISRQVVSRWTNGLAGFDDEHAAIIAEILQRDPGEVMALCHAQRAKDEKSRGRWLRVAALVAASMIPPAAGAGPASFDHSQANNMDYAKLHSGCRATMNQVQTVDFSQYRLVQLDFKCIQIFFQLLEGRRANNHAGNEPP